MREGKKERKRHRIKEVLKEGCKQRTMDRDREGGIKTENLKKINKKIVLDN